MGVHATSLHHDSKEPRFIDASRLTIGGPANDPLFQPIRMNSLLDKVAIVTTYLPGMNSKSTLIMRRRDDEAMEVMIEVNSGAVLLKRRLGPTFAPRQFDDLRRRTVVPSKGVTDFDLLTSDPLKRTKLPKYPGSRMRVGAAMLQDGRILASFSVVVGRDPKNKPPYPGATDEVLGDILALYIPKTNTWKKIADLRLWGVSANGAVLLVGSRNLDGKHWLVWPK